MTMEPEDPEQPATNALEAHARAAGRVLEIVLAFAAGFTLIFTVGLLFAIGGGRDLLAGRLAVAVAGLLALGAIDTQAGRYARRRRPILGPDPPGYRQYVVWSAVGLGLAGALLLGLAWFMP